MCKEFFYGRSRGRVTFASHLHGLGNSHSDEIVHRLAIQMRKVEKSCSVSPCLNLFQDVRSISLQRPGTHSYSCSFDPGGGEGAWVGCWLPKL